LTAALPAAKGSATFSGHPDGFKDSDVAKPELGTKRLCANCGAKFYDLSKDPIVCPKCETVFQVVVPTSTRGGAAARAKAKEDEPESADVELVSLEDADAEQSGGKKAGAEGAEGDDDIEVEETEEAPFIEENEEGDDDVSDLIGDASEDEEES
jgi:uncharacterized protein (TIGR02300 family)